jgi:hypothetical protein
MKKRTTISTETREVWVIRELNDKVQATNPETANSGDKPIPVATNLQDEDNPSADEK